MHRSAITVVLSYLFIGLLYGAHTYNSSMDDEHCIRPWTSSICQNEASLSAIASGTFWPFYLLAHGAVWIDHKIYPPYVPTQLWFQAGPT